MKGIMILKNQPIKDFFKNPKKYPDRTVGSRMCLRIYFRKLRIYLEYT